MEEAYKKEIIRKRFRKCKKFCERFENKFNLKYYVGVEITIEGE